MAALLAEKREKGDSGEGAVLSVQAYRSCAATVVKLLWSQSTWFERASKLSYDSPLGGGNTPQSDKDSLTLQELMALCTKLSDRVLALETELRQTKKVYGTAYTKLIMKMKKLEKTVKTSQARRRAKIVVLAKVLADAAKVHTYSRRRRAVSTGSGGVSTAGMIQQVNIIISSSSATKDKGKAIMTKSELEQITKKLKQRQERAGYEAAIRLQEQLNEEESQWIARDAEIEWADIRARVEADEEPTQKLQAEERDKYSEVDQARMLVDLINQRKRYFVVQKA
ncbi:hypothetical protein Tco_0783658, partial [Tanacetum coccineum]